MMHRLCAAGLSLAAGLMMTALPLVHAQTTGGAPSPHASGGPRVDPNKPYRVQEAFAIGKGVVVRALAVDEARNSLWIGSSVGALEVDLATRDMKNTFTRQEGLANEYVFAIHVDPAQRVWFGTNGGGMSQYATTKKWKTYFPMHGLADYWVYSFATQGEELWIGTWAGVNRFNADSGQFTTYVKELVNEWVYGIAVDKRNQVWFGTEGGVSMFDGQAWRAWTHENGLGAANKSNLPISTNTGLGTRSRHDLSVSHEGQDTYNPNYVFCVLVAKDQSVWAGTWGGGASQFDGKVWRNITRENGLAGDIVFSLAQDKNDHMWFGTHRGATFFDGKTWSSYTRQDGLMGDSVYAVATTTSGDVWLATQHGVTRLVKQSPITKAK